MFKPGMPIVYDPTYCFNSQDMLLKPGDVAFFLSSIVLPGSLSTHCIVVTYTGKVITMLDVNDFRLATEDEI